MASSSGSALPRYIAQRVLLMIPMIWLVLTLVFLMLRVAPGDPVSASVGGRLSEAGAGPPAGRDRSRPAADRAVPRVPR